MKFGFKRTLTIWLAILMMLPVIALGEDAKEVSAAQLLRVRLDRLNILDRLDIKIDGIYGVTADNGTLMVFPKGSELVVSKQENHLLIYYAGMSLNAGADITFKRYSDEGGQAGGLYLQEGKNIYEGDLYLSVKENIQAVLAIHLEDYLYGVVPYEMSNSFPIEALKAQAIAARTYALKRMGKAGEYDLVDTTNDQVFMGRNFANEQAARAIEETRGVVAFYEGKPADCYYTASNGGHTEKASHVWGGGDVPYNAYVADEYDLKNPRSIVKSFKVDTFSPNFNEETIKLMLPQLKKALEQQGLVADAALVRIERADKLELKTPMYGDGSPIMTELSMEVSISGKKRIGAILPENTPKETEEEFTLFETPKPSASPSAASENIFEQATAEPTPEPIIYSDFIAVPDPILITLKMFPELDNALNLSINASENEVITLEKTANGYTLYARRFGHGVGMSQRGAEYMAGEEGKAFHEILAFYYPGVQLMRAADNVSPLPTINPAARETPGPKPTATPKPTLVPVTQELPEGAWYATVTGIEADSWLNLRQEPGMEAPVVMRLYKDQRLIVLERCEEEGFVKVKNDVAEGYVVESFLTKE